MSIASKNWDIKVDKTPGSEGLRVTGTVTVPTAAYHARLVPAPQPPSSDLRLDLTLDIVCGDLPLEAIDRNVSFFEPGSMKYDSVSVYNEDELLFAISDFLMQPKF